MSARCAALLAVVALVAACGADRSTPRGTFDLLRSALVAHDGRALDELTDANGVLHRRAEIRERRAMLARGDDPLEAMAGMPLQAAEATSGTEADAAAILLERRSPLFAQAQWLENATVVEEIQDGPDCVCLKLKGKDDVRRELWFVKEDGRWCYDQFRSRQNW